MKRLFIFIFIFIFSQIFAQEYGQEGYQEKRYLKATEAMKNNQFESAYNDFYFVHKYKNNDLSIIALKKADSILPFAQQNIRKKIVGKWILYESGSNWGFEKEKETDIKKLLIIELDKFSFYNLNIKTNEMTLTKSEKSVFTKHRDMGDLPFDFVFSDKTLWNFYYNEEKKVLQQYMTGEESENSRTEIVCGNMEYKYIRME
ncbi:hypothetical protein [Flavobacterium granuli]|uniref:Uncharacterized protein n=1 Tax=Flavobacterium granuli TaxID=280093 RepID=A0A1M5U8T7_9FLAO|nr:hypothetical protein [Flavobacterium granuli]PRZ19384.1 hypothetical protein BC624_1174 [Flavobacterium granuli]SHH59331.1 hypothetical protein SAMN05443373_1194 [Flavobacterium granuli]